MTTPSPRPDAAQTLLDQVEALVDSRPELALERLGDMAPPSAHQARARNLAARAHWLLGLARRAAGDREAGVMEHRWAAELQPEIADLWIGLGDALTEAGDKAAAGQAYMKSVETSVHEPALVEAAAHLSQRRLDQAERILRERLKARPTDVAAIRMLGELASRIGRNDDAVTLLRRSLELAPQFDTAREFLARLLGRDRPVEALQEIDALLLQAPGHASHLMFKASLLVRLGGQVEAKAIYQGLLATNRDQPNIWMSLGHVLKTLGETPAAIDAYRNAIALKPTLGEAWWSLANLKTFRFTEEDRAKMQTSLADATEDDDRLHLHFALGKALEDAKEAEASFAHYDSGNRLRRTQLPYSADDTEDQCRRIKRLFTSPFLEARAGQGCLDPDPIFILGLPRSGSTLVEQILASHSQVEGTMELPDLLSIAARLRAGEKASAAGSYPELIAELAPATLRALGEEYIARTRPNRLTDRPFFIDKLPNNWQHVGLIRLILPNAKIIDARRHPMACGLSGWTQHFARGQAFSYDLRDIGRYYRDYASLMARFDEIAPGAVHRVIYEQMVADTENEVRRLLDYLGLPFEASCLAFHQNDRAVRTASSEQVRRPIYKDGLEHWRMYEPWLGPLAEIVKPIADLYPEPPIDNRQLKT